MAARYHHHHHHRVGVRGIAVGVGVLGMAYVGEVGGGGVVDWCGGWSVILLLCVCGEVVC